MQQVPALQEKFQLYEQHVKALAEHHHLRTWGCSFEVSLNAVAVGRVHCHDYIGPSIDAMPTVECTRRVVEFKESDCVWDGHRAFVSITDARGNLQPRHTKNIIGALYYVISNKMGSLFCNSSRVPFQDGWLCSLWHVMALQAKHPWCKRSSFAVRASTHIMHSDVLFPFCMVYMSCVLASAQSASPSGSD